MNKLLIAYWRDWRADIYRWIAAIAIFALFAWFMADYYDYFDRCVNDALLCTPHSQSADTAK
jgi:hypothetical protein